MSIMVELLEPKYESTVTTTNPEIAEQILSDLDTFVLHHSQNLRPYIATYLIMYQFGIEERRAKKAKQLVEAQVSDRVLEAAGDALDKKESP